MREILLPNSMKIFFKIGIRKLLFFFTGIILISGCARFSQYALEDVEKQRLKSKNGDEKALVPYRYSIIFEHIAFYHRLHIETVQVQVSLQSGCGCLSPGHFYGHRGVQLACGGKMCQ